NLDSIRWWHWPLWASAAVTAYYFHPMVMYAAVFACGWMILRVDQNRKTNWKTQRWPVFATMLVMLGAISFVKYKWLKLDWYDAAALKRTKAFTELWPNWIDLPSNRDLWQYCLSDYWFVPAGLLVSVVYYLWKKQFWTAAFTALYPMAYVFLVNVPYHESTHQFYMENLWLPLGLFAAAPLVFDVLPGLFSEKVTLWVVAVISFIGIARIAQAHEPWTARLRWEQQFLEKTGNIPEQKLLLTENQVPMDTFKLAWGMAYEFLMLSSLESPEQVRSILVTNEPQRYDTLLAKPRLFLGPFKNYEYAAMPARYFQLQDTSAYIRWKE
ncbi:MAG: hypothetical protein JNJ57_21235, partial [Saprospiraceae bacterium]|nr:hypothetical protein [Saprospiraceae bacterium]